MSEVAEKVFSEEVIHSGLTRSHRVPERSPNAPVPISCKHHGVVPEGIGRVGAEQRRHLRLSEDLRFNFGEHTQSRQEAQQAVERGSVATGGVRESIDVLLAPGKEI